MLRKEHDKPEAPVSRLCIAIYAGDILGEGTFTCTGSEARWALNWKHLIEKRGHVAVLLKPGQTYQQDFDFYLIATRPPVELLPCNISTKGFVILKYGFLNLQDQLAELQIPNQRCLTAFSNKAIFSVAKKVEKEFKLKPVLLPTPYTEDMLPDKILTSFDRNEITWLSKKVWSPKPLSVFLDIPYTSKLALWTLEALHTLSKRADFIFNMVEDNEMYLSFNYESRYSMPDEAASIFKQIAGARIIKDVDFAGVLSLYSRSKVSLPIGKLVGSTIEALFLDCVPLGYSHTISTASNVLTPAFMTSIAADKGQTLPAPEETSKEQIYDLLERLWFDERYYKEVRESYREEFSPHKEENAWKLFLELLEN